MSEFGSAEYIKVQQTQKKSLPGTLESTALKVVTALCGREFKPDVVIENLRLDEEAGISGKVATVNFENKGILVLQVYLPPPPNAKNHLIKFITFSKEGKLLNFSTQSYLKTLDGSANLIKETLVSHSVDEQKTKDEAIKRLEQTLAAIQRRKIA